MMGEAASGISQAKLYTFYSTKSAKYQTRQDWQEPDKIIDPNVDLWFTDGSGIHDSFGAGI
jgi:hypothetical protein